MGIAELAGEASKKVLGTVPVSARAVGDIDDAVAAGPGIAGEAQVERVAGRAAPPGVIVEVFAEQFSGNVHAPTVQIFKDQRIAKGNVAWRPDRERVSPYQVEWDVLLDAVRNDKPHNEAERSAYANLASIMGRAAIHSGKIITWDEMLASDFTFCDNVAEFTPDTPAPAQADDQGRYPVAIPGKWSEV